MNGNLWWTILVIMVVRLIVDIGFGIYRAWRRTRKGPTQREFTDAVRVINSFMVHHNRTHPKEKITKLELGLGSTEVTKT